MARRKEKDRITTGVYLVDKSLFDDKSYEEIIEQIINTCNSKIKNQNEHFVEQELKEDVSFSNFSVHVYYQEKNRTPPWKSFLKPILDPEADLLKGKNHDNSYIAFVCDTNLYAICGGQGNFVVQEYINQNFGIEIISRIISDDSKVIKVLQDRGLTGIIFASTKHFRGDYRLSDEDEFGKIYKQITAELGTDILIDKFGFSGEDIKRKYGCIAKTSFQVNKSVDFSQLIKMLGKISNILSEPPKVTLNKVNLLVKRGEKNKKIIKELENELFNHLFRFYQEEQDDIDFEFCNPDYEHYLTAQSYNLFKGHSQYPIFEDNLTELNNIRHLLVDLKTSSKFNANDFDNFTKMLGDIRVESYDTEGNLQTKGKLLKHLHGEVHLGSEPYFLVDGDWYQIQSDFIEDLNSDCTKIIDDALDSSILDKTWNNADDENTYNQKYIGADNFLVLDKILPENIELCDILKYSENECIFVHVKKGFNNSIRDLTSQVFIAARRLIEDIERQGEVEFIEKLYRALESKSSSGDSYFSRVYQQIASISLEDFKSILDRRKGICFCLAFVDTAIRERDIQRDIQGFKSNIAKFSLIELQRKLRGLSQKINFKVVQIQQQDNL